MRIIDKNTDFYDYLQNIYRDDSLTFDRTGSFLLTKELMCKQLYTHKYYWHNDYWYNKNNNRKYHNFLLLQVCNTFWLFLVYIKEFNQRTGEVEDYDLKLIHNWKNYDKDRVLFSLNVVEFNYTIERNFYNKKFDDEYDEQKIINKVELIEQAINTSDYKIERRINKHVVYMGDNTPIEKNFPLLSACGLAKLIDPLDIFLSFEEYFSTEKSESERIEAIGSTNEDKIESHGFDTKISFRGKYTNN